MKTIDRLDDTEAVYSLYLTAERGESGISLDDPEAVRTLVRDALASVAGPERAEQALALLADDGAAGNAARAALALLQREPGLVPGAAEEIPQYLERPPRADKLDFGVSLSLLAFGAIAMTLMGSFKLERTQKGRTKKGKVKETTTRVEWKGSPAASKVVKAVMSGLGLK